MLDHEAIRRLRKKAGLTMEQAAKQSGMKYFQAWYAIESGRRPSVLMQTLSSIAATLKCSVADLLLDSSRTPRRTPKLQTKTVRKRSKPTKNG